MNIRAVLMMPIQEVLDKTRALRITLLAVLMILSCCTPNIGKNLDSRDDDLYNRVGFKPGSTPNDIRHNNDIARMANEGKVKVVPDFYYRAPDKRPVRVKPSKKRSRPPVQSLRYEPSSRYYNNPYSFKPPLNFPYFDSDQYYVPPTGYDNKGYDQSSGQRNNNNNNLY